MVGGHWPCPHIRWEVRALVPTRLLGCAPKPIPHASGGGEDQGTETSAYGLTFIRERPSPKGYLVVLKGHILMSPDVMPHLSRICREKYLMPCTKIKRHGHVTSGESSSVLHSVPFLPPKECAWC